MEVQMSNTSLLDAVRVVKENERIASQNYASAAEQVSHRLGKGLFTQLSEFEQFHLERLTALEKSLVESGDFIDYQGREFPLPPVFEIQAAREPNQKSIMTIISQAIELEQQAQKAYTDLAHQSIDPRGKKMFVRLAEEESIHQRILLEAYWTMNEMGIWKWSRPPVVSEIPV
jgi:rubrerythrin